MKTFYTIFLVLFTTLTYSQTTYKSSLQEHWYDESDSESVKEEMIRYITIGKDFIKIASHGKYGTDIQRWVITNKINVENRDGSMEVMPTYLASGELGEYPATFTIYYKGTEVDYITCLIPAMFYDSLPARAPIGTKFIIN